MNPCLPIEVSPLPAPPKPLLLRVMGRSWPFMGLACIVQFCVPWVVYRFATTEGELVAWKADLVGWLSLGCVLVLAMLAGWATMRQRTERLTAAALAGVLVPISGFSVLPLMAWVALAFAGSAVWYGIGSVIHGAIGAAAIWAVPAAATGMFGGWLATRGATARPTPRS